MLTRWNDFDRSFAMLDELRRRMDSLLTDWDRGGLSTGATGWPRVNLFDADSQVVLEAELPGVNKDDLDILVTRDGLTLSGKRTVEVPEGYSVHRRERGAIQSMSGTSPCPRASTWIRSTPRSRAACCG